MTGFLSTLAEISLSMGAVIALLLLLSPLLRRYAAQWRYWLWLAVAVRLLIPVNFSLPSAPVSLSVPAPPAVSAQPAPDLSPAPGAPGDPSQADPPSGLSEASDPAGTADRGNMPGRLPARSPSAVLFALWLGGALLLLAWNLLSHWRFRRYVRRWAVPAGAEEAALLDALSRAMGLRQAPALYTVPGLASPMLTGFLRPAVLLPELDYTPDALSLILRHELTHHKRRDLYGKVLLLGARLVHWFNPLVWLLCRAAERDMELCCDDAVLSRSPGEAARYASLILSTLTPGKEAPHVQP